MSPNADAPPIVLPLSFEPVSSREAVGVNIVSAVKFTTAADIWFYNYKLPHQNLSYRPPSEVYSGNLEAEIASIGITVEVSD